MPRHIILDCYTDEPSGYGVPPYIGTHVLHLSQALHYMHITHAYLTIDDLRCSSGLEPENTIRTRNTTRNVGDAQRLIADAHVIHIVMGCFVQYQYFSAAPPLADEVYGLLQHTGGKKILFYVMGTIDGISPDFRQSKLASICTHVEHGNTYRAIIEERFSTVDNDLIAPRYDLLSIISSHPAPILDQVDRLIICEVECGTGCNTPTCTFCIEALRAPKVTYRTPDQIIRQITAFYHQGIRHFRLGRQPNFFNYMRQDVSQLERLLSGIRESCPDIRVLHIDNVNIIDVIKPNGIEFTKLIARFCSSGNVAPFGVESFDPAVRKATHIIGSADDVLRAIEIINEHGAHRGEDGQPSILPGINLIYNLPGQTAQTHDINLQYLSLILERGLMTQRLYYRNMTQATGASFGSFPNSTEIFANNFSQIIEMFVMPMQSRVYPPGTIITADWESAENAAGILIRAIGTCSIKITVSELVAPNQHKVKINSSIGYRLLRGEFCK